MTTFEQTFEELPLAGVHDLAAARHAEGWRYVQILAVNTEEGIDLVLLLHEGRACSPTST